MISAANYTGSVLVAVLAGYKLLRAPREPASAPVRHVCAFLLFLALGLTVMAPASLTAASRAEPVPNLARLAGNALELAAARSVALFAYSVVSPDLARRRALPTLLGLGVSVTGMTVFLVRADTSFTVNFVNVYAHNPAIVAYELVFLGYSGSCLVAFMRLIRRYTRGCEPRLLRIALRIIVGATAASVGWVAWTGLRPLIALLTGWDLATTLPVGSALGAVCVGSWLVGVTLMAWASYLTGPVRWARSYLAYRALGPLWAALTAQVPGLGECGRGTRPGWDAEFALCQRVIEIRDAQFALRGYVHPDVAEWTRAAAHRTGQAVSPVLLEAAELAVAAEAAHAGRPRSVRADPSGPPADRPRPEPSVAAEARWLAQVGRAFTRSPVVRQVRQTAASGLTEPGGRTR